MQLSPAEVNYPVHERELLAVVRALDKWCVDLLGIPFTVYTDHRTLENFIQQKNLSWRQARWQEFLGQYDFRICYLPGEENSVADALSRVQPKSAVPLPAQAAVGSLCIASHPSWLQRIKAGYTTDPWCACLLASPSMPTDTRSENGLLYIGDCLIIPPVADLHEHLFRLAVSMASGRSPAWLKEVVTLFGQVTSRPPTTTVESQLLNLYHHLPLVSTNLYTPFMFYCPN